MWLRLIGQLALTIVSAVLVGFWSLINALFYKNYVMDPRGSDWKNRGIDGPTLLTGIGFLILYTSVKGLLKAAANCLDFG